MTWSRPQGVLDMKIFVELFAEALDRAQSLPELGANWDSAVGLSSGTTSDSGVSAAQARLRASVKWSVAY